MRVRGAEHMQTMTDLSAFHLEMSEQEAIPQATGLVKRFKYATEKVDWFQHLAKIEKWSNRLCLIIVAASALYFAPIVISILFR
jgi:hypothetical protein